MKFKHFRTLMIAMMVAAILIAIAGSLLIPENSTTYQVVLYGDVGLLILAILLTVCCGKCPHCGQHLYTKSLKIRQCPKCKKNLFGEVGQAGRRLK